MKRFRILRSRKRLFSQSKQIFAGLSETKTEIDVLKGTLRWTCFFYRKFFCFYWFFGIWAKILWLLAKMFQKVPKNINLRIPSNNSSGQVFFENMIQMMHIFEIEAEKNRFLSLKVSEALRKPHFPCPQQTLKKKFEKKLTFPSVPDFEQSYRGFEQKSSCIGKKVFLQLSKLRYTFQSTLRG